MFSKLASTDKANALLEELKQQHGEILIYLGGGCCDGSQPLCVKAKYYRLRNGDVRLGIVQGVPFWVDRDMFEYWKHIHFTLDVMDRTAANDFSLESPKGVGFILNQRLLTEEESANLEEVYINKV